MWRRHYYCCHWHYCCPANALSRDWTPPFLQDYLSIIYCNSVTENYGDNSSARMDIGNDVVIAKLLLDWSYSLRSDLPRWNTCNDPSCHCHCHFRYHCHRNPTLEQKDSSFVSRCWSRCWSRYWSRVNKDADSVDSDRHYWNYFP